MRKKKFPLGKWMFIIVLAGVVGGGYWLSLERSAPDPQKLDTPVELKLQPIQ